MTGVYAPPTPTREVTARSGDGVELPVEIHGEERDPAVVLVHGWTCSTLFWAPVIRELTASGHRVIAYDQRGHGRSPVGDTAAYSTALLADDLCAVLDAALEPGERAVIGGHSMGGMTLMAAAGRRELTEHAAGLLLCSTGSHRLAPEARVLPLGLRKLRALAHRALLHASLPLGPVTPVTRRALAYGTLGHRPSPATVEATARIVHACPARVRGAWGGVLARLDLAAKLPRLDVPTAVITGRRDRLTPYPHSQEMAAALPHCTEVRELPTAGHMTPLERPDVVSEVLAGLVRTTLRPGSAAPGARADTTADSPAPSAGSAPADTSGGGPRRKSGGKSGAAGRSRTGGGSARTRGAARSGNGKAGEGADGRASEGPEAKAGDGASPAASESGKARAPGDTSGTASESTGGTTGEGTREKSA
ncbi:alpha/beta fold hydrolase [Streptomyces sp. AJS327]|nr:alpha/beta fold hydrolase [Streptomyces sp. AJS327]